MANIDSSKKFYEVGEVILDKYKVTKKVAEGGMASTIYLADNLTIEQNETFESKSNRKVAIKVINRSQDEGSANWNRFCDECKTNIRIKQCPNVIITHEAVKSDDNQQIIIVMEYIDGKALSAIISEKGALGVEESLFIFSKILEALKNLYSFKEKIIHRDLKPENILLTRDQTTVKIIDFGISSVIVEDINHNDKKILTDESNQSGTYAYYSPHMYNPVRMKDSNPQMFANALTAQCDFFAIGIILYEMLTGSKPFYAPDYEDTSVISLPTKYDIPPLSKLNAKIPSALENVIFRCTASKPDDKKYNYKDINEIINDVQNIINHPDEARLEKLIKPYEKRTLQNIEVFNIESEEAKLKFYNKKWFFWVVFFVATICITLILVIVIINEFFK